MALTTMAHLSKRAEPASTEELARLALVLSRIESADKRRLERERARAAAKAEEARRRVASQGGLSPEVVAIIRGGGRGQAAPAHAPAHRDIRAGRPLEPRGIPSIPVHPGQSRRNLALEIAPRVYRTSPQSILSLGPEGSGPP